MAQTAVLKFQQINTIAALAVSVAILLIPSPLKAEPARLDSDLLSIPVVIAGDRFYEANFTLNTAPVPAELELVDAIELQLADTTGASAFSNNILFISDVVVDGTSYWLQFELIGNTTFVLLDYDINDLGLSRNSIGLTQQPVWLRAIGEATDIGVGADGSVWALGTDERKGGFGIYRWIGNTWARIDGAAVRIDVDHEGNPWIVNDEHQIFRYRNGSWQRLPGDARDIGVGANGAIWVVSGGGVYRWNGLDWDRFSGSGTRIDVDPSGIPWVVDSTGDIYVLENNFWLELPGEARDIGVGADGSVWIIGTRSSDGGHGIYRWVGSYWNQVEGSARHISADQFGKPWVVSSDGKIYRAQ